jgi:hypothetical protein
MRKVADCSFVHFVYPFLFEAMEFDDRVAQLEAATCNSGTEANEDLLMWIPLWKEKGFPRDDMLTYVAGFLNPKNSKQATARFWKLNDKLDEAFGLARCADWQLVKKGKKKEKVIPFRFGEVGSSSDSLFAVQFALFRVGVGFLTVRTRPESNEVNDWLDFISNFRFVKGQRQFVIRATKRVKDRDTHQIENVEFFPALAVDTSDKDVTNRPPDEGINGAKGAEKDHRLFIEILDALLRTGSLKAGDDPWWNEIFIPEQMIPFAIVYVDEETKDKKTDPQPAHTGRALNQAREIDAAALEKQSQEDTHLIYMLRNFFRPGQGKNPAPEDLALNHPSLIPYAERCWFIVSLDGSSFLACDAPREPSFFRQTMPDHLRDQYLLLLLIVLHQRFALMSFSHDVVTKWITEKDIDKRMIAFRRIRDRLLGFTAHGLFTQIMQREHHHRSYRKWQEVFQIKDLYEEIRDEVREMYDYLQMRRNERIKELVEEQKRQMADRVAAEEKREKEAKKSSERLERIIGLLGICFGVPALVIGFLGINIPGVTTETEGLRIWLGLVIVLGISVISVTTILLLLRRYINRAVEEKIEEEKKTILPNSNHPSEV